MAKKSAWKNKLIRQAKAMMNITHIIRRKIIARTRENMLK